MAGRIKVFDCDGHIIESIPEMAEFMDPGVRDVALRPSRNRQGVFAGLDAIHYPRNLLASGDSMKPSRERVNASNHRMGSAEDWVAFLDRVGVEQTVMFPSEGSISRLFPAGGLCSQRLPRLQRLCSGPLSQSRSTLTPHGADRNARRQSGGARTQAVDRGSALTWSHAALPWAPASISVTITTGRFTRRQ